LIPVGYADGYMRWLSNRASVLIHGVECPVVGRVSMDMLTVSLHLVPHAVVGDEAVLIDDDPLSPISAYRIAKLAGTTPYELFTRIGTRIKRIAVDPTDAQIEAETQS
jgi:alanine racemase